MVRHKRVKFCDVYFLADSIWKTIIVDPDRTFLSLHLKPEHGDFGSLIAKPNRRTLLHYFIKSYYTYLLEQLEQQADIDTIIEEYKFILKSYGISFTEELKQAIAVDQYDWSEIDQCYYHYYDGCYYAYYDDYDEIYDLLRSLVPIDDIVHTTFQVLFSDREFLLCFNQIVSEYVRQLKLAEHPGILARDGVLQRASLPAWAKRGVFFRDRGRCIKCGKDLTGTVITGEIVHYDHIVPLAEGGINDPTNFQTLCDICNLKKGMLQTGTSDLYTSYWECE